MKPWQVGHPQAAAWVWSRLPSMAAKKGDRDKVPRPAQNEYMTLSVAQQIRIGFATNLVKQILDWSRA